MIMSKKKRVKTNTFLQSKNKKKKEMKQSKNSKVSSPILVNQNTYGCEIVKREELPSYVSKIISKMRLPNPVKVPIRKRGMTSSGKELCCHRNVNTLTDVYGGKRMIGYSVRNTDGKVELSSHSVWITPENKLVDVTRKTKEQTFFHTNQNDLDYQYFIPLFVITDKEFVLKEVMIEKNYKRNGYSSGFFGSWYSVDKGISKNGVSDYTKKKWNNPTLKDLVGEEKVFFEKDFIDEGFSKKEIEVYKKEKKESCENYFSLPSLFTGKRLYYDISSILKTPLIYTRMLVQR
jgi:hypothetical protein